MSLATNTPALQRLLACEAEVAKFANEDVARMTLAQLDDELLDIDTDLFDAGVTDLATWRREALDTVRQYGADKAPNVIAGGAISPLYEIESAVLDGKMNGREAGARLQELKDALRQPSPQQGYVYGLPEDFQAAYMSGTRSRVSTVTSALEPAFDGAVTFAELHGDLSRKDRQRLAKMVRDVRSKAIELVAAAPSSFGHTLTTENDIDAMRDVVELAADKEIYSSARQIRAEALGGKAGEEEVLRAVADSPVMIAREHLIQAADAVLFVHESLVGMSLTELEEEQSGYYRPAYAHLSEPPFEQRLEFFEQRLAAVGELVGAHDAFAPVVNDLRSALLTQQEIATTLRPQGRAEKRARVVINLSKALRSISEATPEVPENEDIQGLNKEPLLRRHYHDGFDAMKTTLTAALRNALETAQPADGTEPSGRAITKAIKSAWDLRPGQEYGPRPVSLLYVTGVSTWSKLQQQAGYLNREVQLANLDQAIVVRTEALKRPIPGMEYLSTRSPKAIERALELIASGDVAPVLNVQSATVARDTSRDLGQSLDTL